MRILFLYPNVQIELSVNHAIAMLSAVLRAHGHETALIQFNTLESLNNLSKVDTFKPDVVCATVCSNQWQILKLLAKMIKANYKVPFFIGGPHPTVEPVCLEESDLIDGLCIGEGEEALLELVNAMQEGRDYLGTKNFWFRDEKGKIIRNEIRPLLEDLDSLPEPDWSIFEEEVIRKRPTFLFTRGCPFDCSYCINPVVRDLYRGKGRYVRFRSVDSVVREIRNKVSEYNLQRFTIDDDNFTTNGHWVLEFCEKYGKTVGLPFTFNTRPEFLSDEICRNLAWAGAWRVAIGVEMGCEQLRREVLNRSISNQTILAAFRIARKYHINTLAFNMIGIPGETARDFKKTIKLNRKLKSDQVQLSVFYPFPGTRLGNICKEKGYIRYESRLTFYGGDTVLALPGFPREDVRMYYHTFSARVFKRGIYQSILMVMSSPIRQIVVRTMPSPVKAWIKKIIRYL